LNTLKIILKALPEILFTELISRKLLSFNLETIKTEIILKKVLERIPQQNYNTIKCISKILFRMLQLASSPNVVKSIFSFFATSFLNPTSPKGSKKAVYFIKFLFSNYKDLFGSEESILEDYFEDSSEERMHSYNTMKLLYLKKYKINSFN
jgi:hypothetical protein